MKHFYKFIQTNVERRLEQHEKSNGSSGSVSQREDMFHFLLSSKDPINNGPAFTKRELLAESRLLLIASNDTTAVSLSFDVI